MKSVRDINGLVTFISRDEARLFNKIDLENIVYLNTLSERDQHLADEMHKRNVLTKVTRESNVGYKIAAQKQKI